MKEHAGPNGNSKRSGAMRLRPNRTGSGWRTSKHSSSCAQFAGWAISGRLPKQVLYVVDRDKAGNVAYAGPAKPVDMDAKTWNLVKIQALKTFLESWRTVTTDRTAQANDWDRAFLFVGDGSQAKAALSSWFEGNDPIKRANGGELVSIHFKTFDVEGAHTFGIWWEETTTSLAGQVVSRKTWRARVVYEMHIPSSEKAREENSLGLLITELSWEPVQQ